MDKVRELLQLTKEGNEEAREKLILDNVGLIWSVVRRFTNRGYESDDLFQIGSIGLMKAVDKFDLSYDVKFSTYAVPIEYDKGNDRKSLKIRD
ncbi:sigma-70 family RNA polymerase sigma factor, partial [Anaerostipes sp.]|uniref:sigma-70 family RNA polymerase sigma factor n=1 Tax=Anaerostipes sp. TaxID=1872530 RepID=UPI003966E55E